MLLSAESFRKQNENDAGGLFKILATCQQNETKIVKNYEKRQKSFKNYPRQIQSEQRQFLSFWPSFKID